MTADFLEYLKSDELSEFTIKNYDRYLKQFLKFSGDIEVSDISGSLVQKYRLYLAAKPLKQVTQNYFLIALRSFLRYLSKQHIKGLAFDQVTLGKQERLPAKTLNDDDLKKLLDAPPANEKAGIRDKAILETILQTGLRVSGLTALNRGDVSSFWVEKYLSLRQDTFKPLFIRFQGRISPENNGEAMRLTPRSIQRIVVKYVKIQALPVKTTPHTIRLTARIRKEY